MSFFDPKSVEDNAERYRQIIEEQVIISYLSKSISFFDTDMISPYDRMLILDTLNKIKDEEVRQIEEQMKN